MPRAIAFSAKQKREQLQDKRAVKRGELDPSELRYARNPAGNYRPGANHLPDPTVTFTSNKLHSQFIAFTPDYLNRTRDIAHSVPLARPLADETAVFPVEWMERDEGRMRCPSRPAFKFGETKEEVERREEEVFRQWMRDTRGFVEDWVDYADEQGGEDGEGGEAEAVEEGAEKQRELRSPTWFETNLEVWRQLWRVTESSHILLLLADARCPPLHLPTSLRSYVQALRPRKEVILVLTKSDLVEPDALEGWRKWVKAWWAKGYKGTGGVVKAQPEEVQVITVQSFNADDELESTSKRRPDLSQSSHQQFIHALRMAHDRLRVHLASPHGDDDQAHGSHSPVRPNVDWRLLAKDAATIYDNDDDIPELPNGHGELPPDDAASNRQHPLTVGLIGQPNVGKSSLLNAVLGQTRVKAGRTPGKTKHFQTMFWGEKKEIRFVDCPGLVCPSLVGLELQALCGVLPISQLPSLPACILSAARLIPIEEVFNIPLPPDATTPIDPYADKRTWRGPRPQKQGERTPSPKPKELWTAWKIIEGRALDRGYLTAKTGRPDITRAATSMMLALAEGKVRWCFRPPGSDTSDRRGRGIWLGDFEGRSRSAPSSDEDGENIAVKAVDSEFFATLDLADR